MTREEQEKLYEENERLIYTIVGRYYPTWIHDEDVLQQARIGFWHACEIFDPSIATLSTLATRCVLRELANYFKSQNRKTTLNYWQCYSLDYEMLTNDRSETSKGLYEFLEAPTVSIWTNSKTLAELLTERQKDIIRMMVRGLTYREMGEKLGVSRQTIADEKKRITKIIQENCIDI